MTTTGTKTIAEGSEAVARLLKDIAASELDWNEAETRFQIIDRIIVDCFGWPRASLRLEQGQDGQAYSDYELGEPRCAIWEAKRQNRTFDLPADPQGHIVKDLPVLALFTVGNVYVSLCKKGAYALFSAQRRSRALFWL